MFLMCFFIGQAIAQVPSREFQADFLFGAATSALQVEGAWNVDGRGPSVWDTFTNGYPDKIEDGTNTDVTADSYHLYGEDIKAIKSMGVSDCPLPWFLL